MDPEIGTVDKGGTPSAIRAACRAEVLRGLPAIVAIIHAPFSKPQDIVKAWAELAKIGIGAADSAHIHITAEAGSTLGIIQMPALMEADVPLALSPSEEP